MSAGTRVALDATRDLRSAAFRGTRPVEAARSRRFLACCLSRPRRCRSPIPHPHFAEVLSEYTGQVWSRTNGLWQVSPSDGLSGVQKLLNSLGNLESVLMGRLAHPKTYKNASRKQREAQLRIAREPLDEQAVVERSQSSSSEE